MCFLCCKVAQLACMRHFNESVSVTPGIVYCVSIESSEGLYAPPEPNDVERSASSSEFKSVVATNPRSFLYLERP